MFGFVFQIGSESIDFSVDPCDCVKNWWRIKVKLFCGSQYCLNLSFNISILFSSPFLAKSKALNIARASSPAMCRNVAH